MFTSLTHFIQTNLTPDAISKSNHGEAHAANKLYSALMGWDPSAGQLTRRLDRAQLADLRRSVESSGKFSEFAKACLTYETFLGSENGRLRKNNGALSQRHTLIKTEKGIFESLVSLLPSEMKRVQSRFSAVGGHPALPALHDISDLPQNETHNVKIGQGGFGVVRFARWVNNDSYVAYKKIHPTTGSINGPSAVKVFDGLNDNGNTRQAEVISRFEGVSSKSRMSLQGLLAGLFQRASTSSPMNSSKYAFMELGLLNMDRFIITLNLSFFQLAEFIVSY